MNSKSDNSNFQQTQVATAVDELKQNLARAQKNLNEDLKSIKKNALVRMENESDISRDNSLDKLDVEIQRS